MTKIVFVDVDGTLVTPEGDIPASTATAIRSARAQGHRVYLCTGRPMAGLWSDLVAIGFDGYVSGSGAYVESDGQVIMHRFFSPDDIEAIAHEFATHGVHVYYEAHDGVFATPDVREHLLHLLESRFHEPEHRERLLHGMFNFMRVLDTRTDPRTKKVAAAMFLGDARPIDEVGASLGDRFVTLPASTPLYGSDCGEILQPGVHKAEGMEQLLRHLGASWSDTIAIGDSYNDIEMLQASAIGVAMGNAPDEVKQHADAVTGSVLEDGVGQAFRTLGLA